MLNHSEWSEGETIFLLENYNKLTNAELQNRFPTRTWQSIYKKAKKLGLYRDPEITWLNKSVARSGERSPNWNGGKTKTRKGYIQILRKDHHRADTRGYVMEHIAVWEETHGEQLPEGYCIHHINGIKDDNRPENLEALPFGEHTTITHIGLRRSAETRKKISEKRRAS